MIRPTSLFVPSQRDDGPCAGGVLAPTGSRPQPTRGSGPLTIRPGDCLSTSAWTTARSPRLMVAAVAEPVGNADAVHRAGKPTGERLH